MTLVPVDTTDESSVVMLLERVHEWLATAVERSDASEIAAVKAQIATAAEATKQLNLSKEIQLDAQEMVRRAEYALGKAIRKGQAEGAIAKRGDIGGTGDHHRGDDLPRPLEVAGEKHVNTLSTFYDFADQEPSAFDAALADAKAEGNLSRANVARKVKGQQSPTTRLARADLIRELAAQGHSSKQMADRVGVRDDRVREIARAFDIDIPADRVVGGRWRRIDYTQVIAATVTAVENALSGLSEVDFTEVDPTEAFDWMTSLTQSRKELDRFMKQIKEITHV